jgi:thioredoxin 1
MPVFSTFGEGKMVKMLDNSMAIKLLVVLFLVVACTASPQQKKTEQSKQPAPMQDEAVPRMIDLGKTWCIPCKKMIPVIEKAKKAYKGRANIEFIDLEKHPEAADRYHIISMPTQIFFTKDGKEYKRHLGYIPFEDIEKIFSEMGVKRIP